MTFGSLFSGIGGLDLGLERAGMRVVWQSEIEPYCCEVLARHWPHVPNLGDIKQIDWTQVEPVDLICGGFPCQDVSLAGKGAGIKEGTRSGLWFEFERAVGALLPEYVVVENVQGLFNRGIDTVLGALAALGYDAEWEVVRAADVGAPHQRARVFIIAYKPDGVGQADTKHDGSSGAAQPGSPAATTEAGRSERDRAEHDRQPAGRCSELYGVGLADATRHGIQRLRTGGEQEPEASPRSRLSGCDSSGVGVAQGDTQERTFGSGLRAEGSTEQRGRRPCDAGCTNGVAQGNANSIGRGEGRSPEQARERRPEIVGTSSGTGVAQGDANMRRQPGPGLPIRPAGQERAETVPTRASRRIFGGIDPVRFNGWQEWQPVSAVRNTSNGVSAGLVTRLVPPEVPLLASGQTKRKEKLRALGNAVVPQVAQYVGECIVAHWEARCADE